MTADSVFDGSAAASRVKPSASAASQAGGYPQGHLGHLTAAQERALDEFKLLLEERGAWAPGPPASHDDQTLLRFLRARRWVPADAVAQFAETEAWRKANDIDVLYRTIDHQIYEQSRRLYPQWTGRRDKRGIPLYIYEIRSLDSKTISHYEYQGSSTTFTQAKTDGKTDPGMLRLFALYENLTRFNHPFCTQLVADREHPDVPITMSTNIVDVSGVGLKQFWNLKGHMQAASQLATAHYPETLDRIFIVGAPVFFSTVWGWIKRWFDPITVSKIFVLSAHEVRPTLEAFIDRRNIPKKYGGELDYAFGDLGSPDPAWNGVVRWENGHSRFPSGPLLWEDAPAEGNDAADAAAGQKRMVCVRLGSDNGQVRREVVCSMPKNWSPPSSTAAVADQQQQPVAALDLVDSDEGSRGTDMTPNTSASTPAATTIADDEDAGEENGVTGALKRLAVDSEKHEIPAVPAPPATVV
ncbi:SEC14 cytosolic factor [Escovopsis weberi]|uniref:SEC14 cytosolic factor n=1 Tax=Escovopsis weberi TaxID=150374 RepID=A0A0M8N5Y4_ESCWE|nr:SEC14 cytosolic factor [Escovopsis weberi]